MSLKTLLGGDTDLASVRKAKLRTERELAVAKAAVVDAQTAYEVALEEGADDEAMRAVVDKQHVTGWAVSRLTKKIAALTAQIATLEEQARAERLKSCMRENVETALAHGRAAAAANATYWAHMKTRAALMEHGFPKEIASVELPPTLVSDMSSQFSANPNGGAHDALDRWRWSIAQLKQTLEMQQ